MAKKCFDRINVIDNAITLFWSQGYTASSVQLITKHTGLKPGSLYNEFGNKEGLFEAALSRYAELSLASIHSIMEQKSDIKKTIAYILGTFIKESNNAEYCGCFLIKTQLELAAQDNSLYKLASNKLGEVEATYQQYLSLVFDELTSIEYARQLMMIIFSIRIYSYQQKSVKDLALTAQNFLPWLEEPIAY